MTARLTLPVPPTSNHYWKPRAIYERFTDKYIGTIYKTAEAKKYCNAVQLIAQHAGLECHPKGVDVVFHLVWYRGNMRGDLANREKCVEDAMQGVLYENDRQIKAKHTEWILDRANPRVEVWVTRYEEVAAS
ncbi:hypothetical protein LCGC14_1604140 [marine sediment metagenome]|uniref:Uncharacterized protein n=1 Tax=marine sediment metagenome TaxID=412755 RepID=A0A0F9LAB0_9ZZZZ